ncbi:lipid kinase [Candidatus Magnetoovum chiemensis]|nr:lipid kinase [Candidatus Magnetoovum chiemensis]
MEKAMKKLYFYIAALLIISAFCVSVSYAADNNKFRIAWSHYTGWEPWAYAKDAGILDKWAKKYGIEIELTLINDYIESINLYTSGQFDGCVMTNMDALTIPAVGGVDSSAIIIGDFSNGNDGIVTKEGTTVKDLKGKEIKLVELSVSHYLLVRALTINGMKEKDVKLINTSDADIAALFISDPKGAVVTWNPPLMEVRNEKNAKLIFDSSQIPGEIIDMMVVRTNAPDTLKKAITGAWYETMSVMSGRGKSAKEAIKFMAKTSAATEAEFNAQLKTTAMFYKPSEAANFTEGAELKKTMEYVRTFSFDHGLFGQGASDKDFLGIEFPDKTVVGNKGNVKLRFDATYMKMAGEGKL